MDNLLSEIQNEISTIGFDKLKEIHFGAECSSGSESGENDVLDDEYYKNQPPAHSYDSIKDHVVKVNHRPRIQQIRKPYNRTNEFRKRGEARRNWSSGRSGSNAEHALQRESPVHLGYHCPPAPIKERGSSSSSSSNHISNWIMDSSIHQKALESGAIGGTPQRTFPIYSQVFNGSYFITEARRFPDMINKNTLGPTSVPFSRAFSPSSNAVKQVLYNFDKPSGFYNHSTHSSNEKVSEANNGQSSIRNSSQSGGFAENEIVQNSHLLNNLAKMIDMKWSSPAPSSIKQQILIVDQILSTYRRRGMDSNNVTQSNPNTQLPSEQCHTSGDNHPISKTFTDGLFSDQKEQKRVKDVATSNPSKNVKAATLASDDVCKKTAEDIVQEATKSLNSTTKAASDHICKKTAEDIVQVAAKSPTSTTKAGSDDVCKKTAEDIVQEATRSTTSTTKAASDHICKKTAEDIVQEAAKSSTFTTKAASDDVCKETAEDMVQEATMSSTATTNAASDDVCKKTAEDMVQEATMSSTATTNAASNDACKKTAEDIVQGATKSSNSTTKAASDHICKKTAEDIVQEATKSPTSTTKAGSDDVCKKNAEDIVQEATKSSASTTRARGHAENNFCSEPTSPQPTYPTFTDKSEAVRSSVGRQATQTSSGVQSNIHGGTNTQRQLPSEQCQESGGNYPIIRIFTDCLFFCRREQKPVKNVTTNNRSGSRKATMLASDYVCKKTAKDIVQETTRSSTSTTETKAPQPTYPTFTDKSEVVRSSVGRQGSQNSKGVQSNVHDGTITGQPLPIDTREEFLRYIEKMYPREVRTIGCREFGRETIPLGSENKCEEPEKALTHNNESAQTAIVSWFRRILWK
ncbi:unnamed protein product [Callosobruchus maculatus]|uniref:Uncharacterized protein n=1 Tax=Callosobruchus maculatus TaxID=64391 RepID=A0A653C0X2_CALMS|nr:unnamed protein product [Callosobruchus maculatus]